MAIASSSPFIREQTLLHQQRQRHFYVLRIHQEVIQNNQHLIRRSYCFTQIKNVNRRSKNQERYQICVCLELNCLGDHRDTGFPALNVPQAVIY